MNLFYIQNLCIWVSKTIINALEGFNFSMKIKFQLETIYFKTTLDYKKNKKNKRLSIFSLDNWIPLTKRKRILQYFFR